MRGSGGGAVRRGASRTAGRYVDAVGTAGAGTLESVAGIGGRELRVRAGGLSNEQATAIVPAAAADPSAQDALLRLARTTSVSELRTACLRVQAAADPDPEHRHRRIRSERRARTFTDAAGAWNLRARGTVEEGARFESTLQPIIDELFEQARLEGRKEPRDAYAFDALMVLAGRSATTGDGKRAANPRYLGLLHVSAEALARGRVEGEESCEIVGIGPVPVRVARELLGESILKLVITKGVDVANVTHLGRGPTAAQRIALLWSKPKCTDSTCSSMFVQIDHRQPWAKTKHTRLDELDPLCPHHHALKTNQGWALVRGKGRRAFVGPRDPRHPRNRPPP